MSHHAGAKARLLAFLLANVGRVVDSDQLRDVAGISEWGRRVRELRDDGYQIETHHDRSALRPGEYIMVREAKQNNPRHRPSAGDPQSILRGLRGASRAEQVAALSWLAHKYPAEARRLVDEDL